MLTPTPSMLFLWMQAHTTLVCSVNMFYERFEVQFEDARKNLRSDSNNIKSSRPPTSLSGALDQLKMLSLTH